jgi:hypothetical protein
MAFCKHCGNKLEDGVNFCPECGNPTNGEVDVPKSDGNGKNNEESMYFTEKTADEEETEKKSGLKKYLPYILGAFVVLAVIGYFSSNDSNGGGDTQTVAVDTMGVENVASADETPSGDKNRVIADFDKGMVYQGEYIFDAVLTDAALEKKNATFTIKIDGNKVSVPMDEGKVMSGHIYSDDLGIDVVYDYGNDLHFVRMSIKPNDKEGKEWVGEYAFTGMRFDAVLKLKEVKHKGEAVKVTEERTADDSSETVIDDNSDNSSSTYNSSNTSSSSRTFYSEQIVIGYLANQSFRASDGLTMRVDGDGRLYVDGDYAGVLSVLRYNSTSALLRYGGGMYGEGKLTVQIVGDKFQLKDPTDGTVYYQR